MIKRIKAIDNTGAIAGEFPPCIARIFDGTVGEWICYEDGDAVPVLAQPEGDKRTPAEFSSALRAKLTVDLGRAVAIAAEPDGADK